MTKIRPIEFNFRLCTIKRHLTSRVKYVSIEGLRDIPTGEINFPVDNYDVGEQFYAYLVPNKVFSGKASDSKFTLANLSSTPPFLEGNAGNGATLYNCSSGGGKPPGGFGNNDSDNETDTAVLDEINAIHAQVKIDHPDLNLNFFSVTFNDYGSLVVVFTDWPIDIWNRVETRPLSVPSSFGLLYAIKNRDHQELAWNINT